MSTSIESGSRMAFSEETVVRGRRVSVEAKWPMWNLLLLSSRSPFDDLGSILVSLTCLAVDAEEWLTLWVIL